MAKILVVEDNALNIKLFCDLLAAHGHEPEPVLDSRNALDAARALAPGADVYALEAEWRAFWVASGRPRLSAPDRAFLGWVRARMLPKG